MKIGFPTTEQWADIEPLECLHGLENRLRLLRREAAEAPRQAQELLALSPTDRIARLDQDPSTPTLALADLLADRAGPLEEIDPDRAGLSLAVARRLEARRYGSHLVADVRARALLAVAESAVLAGAVERAGCALAGAERFIEQGSGDILLAGLAAECRALLCWSEGSAIDALVELEKAERAYSDAASNRHLRAVALRRGFLLAAAGRRQSARDSFETILSNRSSHDARPFVAAAHWALEQLRGGPEETASLRERGGGDCVSS